MEINSFMISCRCNLNAKNDTGKGSTGGDQQTQEFLVEGEFTNSGNVFFVMFILIFPYLGPCHLANFYLGFYLEMCFLGGICLFYKYFFIGSLIISITQ